MVMPPGPGTPARGMAGTGRGARTAADGKPDRYVQGWLDISKLDYVDGSVP